MSNTAETVKWLPPKKGKKIYIRPVNRQHGMVSDPSHEAYFLFGQSSKEYSLPIGANGRIVYPFTCDEERAWLEKELKTDLNPYLTKDNYWVDRYVVLGKEEKTLDISDPVDYVSYLILLHNKDLIAPSGEQKMKKKTYRYSIEEENFDLAFKAKKSNLRAEAFAKYFSIKDNKTTLVNYLRILGVRVNEDTLLDFAQNKISEYIEKDPQGFLNLVKDPTHETKLFIKDLVEAGLIEVKAKKYFFRDGEPIADKGEPSVLDNTVKYFMDIKNQEVVDNFVLRLKQKK